MPDLPCQHVQGLHKTTRKVFIGYVIRTRAISMPDKPKLFRPLGPTRKSVREGSEDRKADKRFYAGTRWRNLRTWVLDQCPLCVRCREKGLTVLAKHVDHVIDRKERPDLAYDDTNLESLCHSCHSKKTATRNNTRG